MKFSLRKHTITINILSPGPLLYITTHRLSVDEQIYPIPCRCWSAAFHPPTDELRCFVQPEALPRCSFCGRRRCSRVDAFHETYLDGYGDTTINYVCERHAPWIDRVLGRYRCTPEYELEETS